MVDIGCGTGLTTREAARAAAPGRVLGIDVSERMLERAVRSRRPNELGDAQVHRFDPAGFDLAISRFGTMFFSDPATAFANIAAALRPAGGLENARGDLGIAEREHFRLAFIGTCANAGELLARGSSCGASMADERWSR